MAELTINADEIAAALRAHVATFTPTLDSASVGRVLEVGDGIARVAGLPETSVNELLEFEGGTLGLALNLDEDSIGAVVLGEAEPRRGGPARSRRPAASSRCPSATRSIGRVVERARSARSTARARSRPPRCAASRCRRPASSAASRCTSRCRPASRPSTR